MPPEERVRIRVTANGPYVVKGRVPIVRQTIVTDDEGESVDWEAGEVCGEKESCALCRCGHSAGKPFCDGSHLEFGFDGTEAASHATYHEQAVELLGPTVSLDDAKALCAEARFCHRGGGAWNLVEHTSDPETAASVRLQAGQCPSGRYVAFETATRIPFEPDYPVSIGVVQDPHAGVSGPLWVRGGIPVESADGSTYESRNRMTLCRCGESKNKPFCDGSHVSANFREEH